MSAWSVLPNARHIDWVIASLKKHPELWIAPLNATRDAARDATWGVAWDAPCKAALVAAWQGAYDAVWNATFADWLEALATAQSAILALIAYDDCDQYLSMTSEELQAWATLTEHPAAVLLLSMVIVREQIERLESV
jgi:hypothetical protein